MDILIIRGEGIYFESAFGELAHYFHLNLLEMIEIIRKLKIIPILKLLMGTTV